MLRLQNTKKSIIRAGVSLVFGLVVAACALSKPAHALATTYVYPCSPYNVSGYGFGTYVSGWGYHVAEDVCGQAGVPVYAAGDGLVVYSARTPDSYRWGNLVLIEHTNPDGGKAVTLYGHLGDNRQVAAGQAVARGQLIGFTGPSWTATNGNWAAHLHFGVRGGAYGAAVGTYAWWVRGYETSFPNGWLSPGTYIRDRLAPQDYAPTSVPPQTDVSYTGQTTVTFRVRNTTDVTWKRDGNSNLPFRLGTLQPTDRGSGFSQNGTAPGWASPNRIKMTADTAPQGIATFTATFVSNRAPGVYPECFGVLQEGNRWLAGNQMCTNVVVQGPNWRSQFHNQLFTKSSSPTDLTPATTADFLVPGQKVNAKVMLKNVGELPWSVSGANPVRLGTINPTDRASGYYHQGDGSIPESENWVAPNRPSGIDGRLDTATNTVVPDDEITNGEIAVFSWTMAVPDVPGSHKEYLNPIVEGAAWMPNIGLWLPTRILAPGDHFEYASQTNPGSAGLTTSGVDATFRIRNIGRTSWPVGGDVRLGTDRPLDNQSPFYTPSGTGAWLTPNRASAIDRNATDPAKQTVDPGEVAEFGFRLTVPPLPVGTYNVYFRPVREGVSWMEDVGAYFPVKVTVKPYDYQVMTQSYSADPRSLLTGGTTTASFAIRNNGRATWQANGPNPVRLATERPRDRYSGFANLLASDPWLDKSRASNIDARVTNVSRMYTAPATEIKPGETALFRMPMSAAATGSFTEYFNLVAEGIAWLPDKGLNVPLTVKQGSSSPTPAPTPGTPGGGIPPNTAWSVTGDQFASCTVLGTTGQGCVKDTVEGYVASSWTYKVEYRTSDLPSGTYNLVVGYKNVWGALPDGYAYQVKVRVNGGSSTTLAMDGDAAVAALPNLQLSGVDTISLEWTNDHWVPNTTDANLAITSVELQR